MKSVVGKRQIIHRDRLEMKCRWTQIGKSKWKRTYRNLRYTGKHHNDKNVFGVGSILTALGLMRRIYVDRPVGRNASVISRPIWWVMRRVL